MDEFTGILQFIAAPNTIRRRWQNAGLGGDLPARPGIGAARPPAPQARGFRAIRTGRRLLRRIRYQTPAPSPRSSPQPDIPVAQRTLRRNRTVRGSSRRWMTLQWQVTFQLILLNNPILDLPGKVEGLSAHVEQEDSMGKRKRRIFRKAQAGSHAADGNNRPHDRASSRDLGLDYPAWHAGSGNSGKLICWPARTPATRMARRRYCNEGRSRRSVLSGAAI